MTPALTFAVGAVLWSLRHSPAAQAAFVERLIHEEPS